MEKGELVPDEITIGMVKDRLLNSDCQNGALLDGFPRTPAQAQALEEFLAENNGAIDSVPFINVPEDELIDRLSSRWVCKAEGHTFNTKFSPPKKTGICDLDGSELYQRNDDKRETVEQRIRVYSEQTAPLIDFYKEKGLLVEINGAAPIDEVTTEVLKVVACGSDKQ